VPGNHEYQTRGAAGYFAYFGDAAGDPAKGYYSFDLGAWRLVALNSNCGAIGGCHAGSPQEQWLRHDLRTRPARCTLAYWHHPRFSSGKTHGNNAEMQPIWQALQDYGAEIVLSGHEHNYERFAPQTAAGDAGDAGVVQFVVGTGGRGHYGFSAHKPNSLVRNSDTLGVLKLTLGTAGYAWEFIAEAGRTFTDTGTASCRSNDVDADAIADEDDNCPAAANGEQSNADRDQAGDACDEDDDGDGCTDERELGAVPERGGLRDPLDAWDVYDVDRSGAVDAEDLRAILAAFGARPGDDDYDPALDRYAPDVTAPWRTAESTGRHAGIDLEDALTSVQSLGHTCAGP
jgi:hypothetical protein